MYFRLFPIFSNLVYRTWLVVERNGPKFGPHGCVRSVCRVLLTDKCSIYTDLPLPNIMTWNGTVEIVQFFSTLEKKTTLQLLKSKRDLNKSA